MRQSVMLMVIAGILMLLYSSTLDPYTNEEAYDEKYLSLHGENKTAQFYALRKEYLTNKYSLEDYGITTIIIGISTLLLFRKGWRNIKTPNSKIAIVLLGLLSVFLGILGYAGSIYLDAIRSDFPMWADSIAIPLMYIPTISWILLIWLAINFTGIFGEFKTGKYIHKLKFNNINYWYAAASILSLLLTAYSLAWGDFWNTAAGISWSYFYLSMLVGRRGSTTK